MKIEFTGLSPFQRVLALSMKHQRIARINWPLLIFFIVESVFCGWLAFQLGGWLRGVT